MNACKGHFRGGDEVELCNYVMNSEPSTIMISDPFNESTIPNILLLSLDHYGQLMELNNRLLWAELSCMAAGTAAKH